MENFRFIFHDVDKIEYGEIKDNRLITYFDQSYTLKGNIYRAKVLKYVKSLDAYILDIGLEKNGLLKTKNTISNIKPSMDVIVELIETKSGDKLYELSQKYSLTDGYIVYLPFVKSNNKNIFELAGNSYLLRTKRKYLGNEEISNRLNLLLKEHESIQKEKNLLPTPKLIRQSNFLSDFIENYEYEIISNKKISNIIYDKDFNPKYHKLISRQIIDMNKRKIDIRGIEIVIDQLEALTVIDVNSKNKFIDLAKEDMSLKVNFLVIKEIAIQIKLRNIKKMLIIDFLRMNYSDKKILLKELDKIFSQYNLKFKILGYSNLDFVEIIIF
ncbi:MAG: ribonuclease E/G [Helcococcus sp.]|nr:ribonuclease E/G [Helcococcus sp.]